MKDNIPGYPGYHVTKDGKVYSRRNRGHGLSSKWLEMKICNRSNGYCIVVLHSDKNTFTKFSVHRLVAMVYIPNPNNYPVVMHLDDNRTNNKVENLKWGTQSMNIRDAVNKGRSPLGEDHPNAKLSNRQRRRICRLYSTGKYRYEDLSYKFMVSIPCIGQVVKRGYKL